MDNCWWTLKLEIFDNSMDIESLGYELLSAGANGTELLSEREIQCFIQTDDSGLMEFKQIISNLQLRLISSEKVPDINWVQKCEEVWEKLQIDNITITPVMSLEKGLSLAKTTSNEFLIIPGCGFGTGHHATTNQASSLLQLPILKNAEIKRCLDMGTGSGLLAIVANRLFGAQVDAIDNDPDAIRNAGENAILNKSESMLDIKVADALTWSNGEYDLVMANLYAELLEKVQDVLYQSTRNSGYLLISGFHTPEIPELASFDMPRWKRLEIRTADNWTAMLLQKIG